MAAGLCRFTKAVGNGIIAIGFDEICRKPGKRVGNRMAKILIVDDSSFIRASVSDMFRKLGHTVVAEAADGDEALEAFYRHQPDLVTMDVVLPTMNGIDAIKKILEVDPDAKIIMLSAVTQKIQVLQAIKSGAKHYIAKPLTMDKLVEVTNAVLGSDLVKRTEENQKSMKDTIDVLGKTVNQIHRNIKNINKLK